VFDNLIHPGGYTDLQQRREKWKNAFQNIWFENGITDFIIGD